MFEPQAYTLYSYASVQIIKQAAEKANSLDPKKVAEVMRSGMKFNTVLGDLSFDKKGDVSNDGYVVNGVKKDALQVLYTWRKGPDGRIELFRKGTDIEPLKRIAPLRPRPARRRSLIRSSAGPGTPRSARYSAV